MKNCVVICIVIILLSVAKGESTDSQQRERVLRLIPKVNQEARQFLEEGKKLLKQKELDKAIKIFQLALKGAPYHPGSYFFLAKTYFQLGEEAKAFSILEQATRSQADNKVIFNLLSTIDPPLKPEVFSPTKKVFIAPFKDNKQAAMSFSFDDGAQSVYTVVIPLFEKFGFKATIPINPGMITETVSNPWWGSWEQWRDAQSRGFEISNHAMEHHDLTKVDEEELEIGINGAYELIKEKLGKPPLSFAFPQDQSQQREVMKVSERHIAARQRDILTQVYDNIFIPVYGGNKFSGDIAKQIVDLALLKRLWLIAECHAIDVQDIKTYKPITADFLEEHLTYIKENEDKIWADTFINVYLYLLEKKSTQLYFETISTHRVEFILKTPLDPQIYNFPLTIIIDTSPIHPKIASAVQQGTLKLLPVKIQGDKLHIEVVPGTPPVEVTWE